MISSFLSPATIRVCLYISPEWSTMNFFDDVFLNSLQIKDKVLENAILKIKWWDWDTLFSFSSLEQLPMTIHSAPQCAVTLLKTITSPPSFFIHPLHSPVCPIPLSAVSLLPLALALSFLLFPPSQIIKWHYFGAFKEMYSLGKETFGLRNRSLQLSVRPSAEPRRTANKTSENSTCLNIRSNSEILTHIAPAFRLYKCEWFRPHLMNSDTQPWKCVLLKLS